MVKIGKYSATVVAQPGIGRGYSEVVINRKKVDEVRIGVIKQTEGWRPQRTKEVFYRAFYMDPKSWELTEIGRDFYTKSDAAKAILSEWIKHKKK